MGMWRRCKPPRGIIINKLAANRENGLGHPQPVFEGLRSGFVGGLVAAAGVGFLAFAMGVTRAVVYSEDLFGVVLNTMVFSWLSLATAFGALPCGFLGGFLGGTHRAWHAIDVWQAIIVIAAIGATAIGGLVLYFVFDVTFADSNPIAGFFVVFSAIPIALVIGFTIGCRLCLRSLHHSSKS